MSYCSETHEYKIIHVNYNPNYLTKTDHIHNFVSDSQVLRKSWLFNFNFVLDSAWVVSCIVETHEYKTIQTNYKPTNLTKQIVLLILRRIHDSNQKIDCSKLCLLYHHYHDEEEIYITIHQQHNPHNYST
jgi:hypothetical protein